MFSSFPRLPLTLRLPLVVASMIFIAAIGTTQTALYSVARQFETQMGSIGQVYLDGLQAALMKSIQAQDMASATRILEQSLSVTVGVQDQRLLLLNDDGSVLARAQRSALEELALPDSAAGPIGAALAQDGLSIWVWRHLQDGKRLLANLDVSSFDADVTRLRWSLLLIDLLISSACALFGFLVARQIQRPITSITEHLRAATGDSPARLAPMLIEKADPETRALMQAVNRMADHTRDRENLLEALARQEREAILGRMAATLAHEVRNPLGGMSAALQTLQKFGDQPEARQDAIAFLERGVQTLKEVTDATLKTHRTRDAERPLLLQDLYDVHRLLNAEAKRRQVHLSIEVAPDVHKVLPVSATEVRQILLNLLLNAVQATLSGGTVNLKASMHEHNLILEVADQGVGLPAELAQSLTQGEVASGQTGLGVAVVVRLVRQLRGRVSVAAHSDGGTCITLYLPLNQTNLSP